MDPVFDQRRYLIPFRSALLPQIFTDVLVIGAGIAGMRAALAASDGGADVIVLAKGGAETSNTAWAQGGVAAVLDSQEDSFESHIDDTITAGAGLCDRSVVARIVQEGAQRVEELIRWGMPFDRNNDGELLLGMEGGHSAHRILHGDGDATGRVIVENLLPRLKATDHVRLFDHCFALDLLTEPGNGDDSQQPRCLGAITHHPKHGLQIIWARTTILASGGCGQVYRETTNPSVATGDGIAMAWRAGAEIADLEFMQFHPTTLYVPGAARRLISEAVRGEGAYLVDESGERFMLGVHDLAELAPRDIVARAILHQLGAKPGNNVYLDARHIGGEKFAARFPGITRLLQQFDIDPGADLIPIRPAAHYMIGGVWADTAGRTNVPGLLACGEASCTGLHGANRLASNSLLEGLVCGAEAGELAAKETQGGGGANGAGNGNGGASAPPRLVSDIRLSDRSELDIPDVLSTLRSVMWRHVGIKRDGARLDEVAEMFDFWARYTLDKIFDDRDAWAAQNLLLMGALMTRAAKWRDESRGTHYRVDCPQSKEERRVHGIWRRGSAATRVVEVANSEDEAGAVV